MTLQKKGLDQSVKEKSESKVQNGKVKYGAGDFVLVRNLNNNKLHLLFCGEPTNEEDAFLYLEKLLKAKVRKA